MLYITAMWVSGIMQGLMWRAYDELGFLQYSFVETVAAMHPFYMIRLLGGVLFLSGGLIMAYNMWRTVRGARAKPLAVAAPAHCTRGLGGAPCSFVTRRSRRTSSCCWC